MKIENMSTFIGIDNGVSGSIGIVSDGIAKLYPTPVKRVLNYTKKKSYVNRVDVDELKNMLMFYLPDHPMINLERPMVNPGRFAATASALRAFEATIIALEQVGLGYQIVDSKQWQKQFLPVDIKGAANLKKASMERGIQMFPYLEEKIKKQGDADGIFLALFSNQ